MASHKLTSLQHCRSILKSLGRVWTTALCRVALICWGPHPLPSMNEGELASWAGLCVCVAEETRSETWQFTMHHHFFNLSHFLAHFYFIHCFALGAGTSGSDTPFRRFYDQCDGGGQRNGRIGRMHAASQRCTTTSCREKDWMAFSCLHVRMSACLQSLHSPFVRGLPQFWPNIKPLPSFRCKPSWGLPLHSLSMYLSWYISSRGTLETIPGNHGQWNPKKFETVR